MRKNQRITPEGTKDYLFGEAAARRQVEASLRALFERRGYSEVITPGLEFLDVYSALPEEGMYRLTDSRGRQMVLRPDSTMPIARLCATRLQGRGLPLRLYYNQPVYTANSGNGKPHEVMQAGAELIGCPGLEGDLEILSMAAETGCRLEIGHIGVFNALAGTMGLDAAAREELRLTIEGKNYPALSDLLDGMGDCPEAAVLRRLPRLFGGREVFAEAERLLPSGGARESLAHLRALYEGLCQRGLGEAVTVDLALVNRADYYTGVVFKGYLEGYGQEALSGGRYDNLLPQFGVDAAAVGFGVNVDAAARLSGGEAAPESRPLRIALTKGRLEKRTVELFRRMGLDCAQLENKGRRLILEVPGAELEVVLAKAADVITYIEHGACDLGIVGKDTILEYGGSFFEVADLGFGRCRFALAGKAGTDFYAGYAEKTIATKYPAVARRFFRGKGMDVRIVKIEGSVELAPLISLADGIVDIVETGSTLRENGLEIIEEVAPVSARLIVNPVSLKLRKQEIEPLIDRIERCL